MKELNNKIRNSIANSYHLRELAKDRKTPKEKSFELNELARENDKKIIFFKKLSNVLKENEKDNTTVKSK